MKILPPIIFILLFSLSVFAQDPKTFLWDKSDKCKICDQIIIEGQTYRIIEDDKYYVAISPFYEKNHLVTFIYVENKTDQKFDFRPFNDAQLLTWKRSSDFPKNSEIVTIIEPEKIAKKLANKAKWQNVLRLFAAGMQTRSARVVMNAPGLPVATATVTLPDDVARDRAAQQASDNSARALDEGNEILSYALKANTVFPKTSISGHVFYPNKKSETLVFNIKAGDTIYMFPYFLK